jgi:hypothetical protein
MRAELIFSLTCLGLCSAVVSRQGPNAKVRMNCISN